MSVLLIEDQDIKIDKEGNGMADTQANLSLMSPAKINLFLHIIGKRADGYHQLQTLFRLLNWGDHLHFYIDARSITDLSKQFLPLKSPSDAKIVHQSINQTAKLISEQTAKQTTENANIAALIKGDWVVQSGLVQLLTDSDITADPADNLIIKAAAALLNELVIQNRLPSTLNRVVIRTQKRIPMGAGLGGGSSNAATTLIALNELWQLGLTQAEMMRIGATVGADVPIFIFNQDAIGEGIGEQLSAISLPKQRYLLLFPQAHISTAKLFAHANLQRNCPPLSHQQIIADQAQYLYALKSPYQNVFEPLVSELSIEVNEALNYLHYLAAKLVRNHQLSEASLQPRMTGSGSTVLLPLPSGVSTDTLEPYLDQAPCPVQIVSSLYGDDECY